VGFEKGQL